MRGSTTFNSGSYIERDVAMELFPDTEHERSVTIDRRRLPADASDEVLWHASQEGEESAFAALYERHAGKIYNYLFLRLADWSEAEELTAVVFLEAFRRRTDAVIVEGKLLPWLYGIATNVLRNRRRAQWRHRQLLAQKFRARSLTGARQPRHAVNRSGATLVLDPKSQAAAYRQPLPSAPL